MGEVSFDKRVRIAKMKRAAEDTNKDIQEFAGRFPELAKAFENVMSNQYKLFARKCVDYGIEKPGGGGGYAVFSVAKLPPLFIFYYSLFKACFCFLVFFKLQSRIFNFFFSYFFK